MNWLVRRLTELEMNMNSVERILDYAEVPREVDTTKPATRYVAASARWFRLLFGARHGFSLMQQGAQQACSLGQDQQYA